MPTPSRSDYLFCPIKNTTPKEAEEFESFHRQLESLFPENLKICTVFEKSGLHESKKLNLGVFTKSRSYSVETTGKNLSHLLSKTFSKMQNIKLRSGYEEEPAKPRHANLNLVDSETFLRCPVRDICSNVDSCPLKINRKYKFA